MWKTVVPIVTHWAAVVFGVIAVVAAVVAAVLAIGVWRLRRRGLPTESTVAGLRRCMTMMAIALVGLAGATVPLNAILPHHPPMPMSGQFGSQ